MYKEKREEFYKTVHHFWPDVYGSEYALYHSVPITNEKLDDVREATKKLGQIFFKAADLLRVLPNESLLELGFPKESISYIRSSSSLAETVIGRFDFIDGPKGLKMIEINADTPTFIKECFSVNGLICSHFGQKDPNEGMEPLLSRVVTNAVGTCSKALHTLFPHVVFTAHEDHEEDWNTAAYLQSLCQIPSMVVPLKDLRISEEELVDHTGRKIDILWRQTYPIEHLIHDEDEEGEKVGLQLLDLALSGKLSLINPPSAFLMQSKAVQALIWGLCEEGEYFTEEERKDVFDYMLPTYLDEDILKGKRPYVKKPSFGREGDTVEIYDVEGNLINKAREQTYDVELPVYQEFTEMPVVSLETEKGQEELSCMYGSFLIGGMPGAIGIRAGGTITSNESYYLPVYLKDYIKTEWRNEND